jgi:hypothetical protein
MTKVIQNYGGSIQPHNHTITPLNSLYWDSSAKVNVYKNGKIVDPKLYTLNAAEGTISFVFFIIVVLNFDIQVILVGNKIDKVR